MGLFAIGNVAVAQVATTTTIATTGSNTLGQPAAFSAQMTATTAAPAPPTGHVFFYDGSAVVGESGLVSYADWAATTSYTNQTITPTTNNAGGFSFQATVAGTSGASAPTFPQTVGGSVVDGGVTWTNIGYAAKATLSTSLLSPGSHSITVFYEGDTNFLASTSGAASQNVSGRNTTISLSLTPSTVTVRSTSATNVMVSDSINASTAGSFASLSSSCTNTASAGMCTARSFGAGILLANGSIGIAGGIDGTGTVTAAVESFDPSTQNFSDAPFSLNTARACATATVLQDGSVLVIGGTTSSTGTPALCDPTGAISSAELTSANGTSFTTLAGANQALTTALVGHTATLLSNGNVLVAGGDDSTGTAQTATYLFTPGSNPSTGTFGSGPHALTNARYGAVAVLLTSGPNAGKVLIAGGDAGGDAEIFDPASASADVMTGSLNKKRSFATATVLPDGLVAVAGGFVGGVADNTVEIYDPNAGTFTLVGGNDWAATTAYSYGTVITPTTNNAGGYSYAATVGGTTAASAPTFAQTVGNTTTDGTVTWTNIGVLTMASARAGAVSAPYSDPGSNSAKVLLAGGLNASNATLGTDESYTPPYDPQGSTTLTSDQAAGVDMTSGCSLSVTGTGHSICIGSVTANHYNLAATHNETAAYPATVDHGSSTGTAQALTVNQQAITVTAQSATMIYDGSVACVAPTAGTCTPTLTSGSILAGDTPTYGQNFDTKTAGTGKVLTPTFSAVDTNDSSDSTGDYVVTTATDSTGVINQLAITVTAVSDTKVYDSTTTSAGVPTIAPGLATGDTATFVQTFDTRHAGTGKTLTVTPSTVSDGNSGNNYSITYATVSTGVITALPITVSAVADTKVYDATTSSAGVPTISPALLGTDTATFTQTFDTRHAGTGKTLTVTPGTVTDGNSGNDYSITYATVNTGVITAKPVTVTAVADTKVYDSTTSSAGVPTISPALLGTDTANFTQTFDTRHAATGKTLTPAGTANDGNSGNDYSYTFTTVSTGVVTAKPITVTAVTDTKVYDSTTSSVGVPTISPALLGTDTATFTQTFDTRHAGTGKTLTVTPAVVSDGNGGNDYSITFATVSTGVVTAKPITVTAVADTKVYDSTTSSAGVPTISPALLGTDTATFTQTFDTRHAGTGKTLTVTPGTVSDGNSGNDYSITYATVNTGVITAKPITVTAVADTKVYDSTTSSAGVPTISPALLGTDTATFTQTFDTRHAGTGKTLTATPGTVSDGNSGNDYSITYATVNTGVITAKPITVTAVADTKVYDATITSSGVPTISPALLGTDTANFLQTFDTSQAGTGKTLTASGSVTDGNGGNDYSYTYVTNTTGAITQRPIIVSAVAAGKTYGDNDPALSFTVSADPLNPASGLAPGETQALVFTGNVARVAGEAAGSYTIQQGTAAPDSNYMVSAYNAATFTISPRPLAVTITAGQAKTYGDNDPATLAFTVTNIASNSAIGVNDTQASVFGSQQPTRAAGETVGTYPINVTGLTADANYTIATFTGANFTINARPLTVTVTAGQGKTYGDNDPVLTFTATNIASNSSTGVNDTQASVFGTQQPTRATGETVGSYAINETGLTANSNYTIASFTGSSFTITPRPLAVTIPTGQGKTFGQPDPGLVFVASNIANNPGIGVSDTQASVFGTQLPTRAVGESAATYAITQGTLTANSNYTIAVFNAANTVFTIAPAATATSATNELTVTSSGTSVTTPGAAYTLTASVAYGYSACQAAFDCSPQGTVTFVDSTNGTTLGTATLAELTPANGAYSSSASISGVKLAAGSHLIQTTFNPSSNFVNTSGSLKAPLSVVAQQSLAPSGTPAQVTATVTNPGPAITLTHLTNAQGTPVSLSISAGPNGTLKVIGFTGAGQIGCAVVAASPNVTTMPTCVVTSDVSATAGGQASIAISISTSGVTIQGTQTVIQASNRPVHRHGALDLYGFGLGFGLPGIVFVGFATPFGDLRKKRVRTKVLSILALILVVAGLLAAVGCGGGGFANPNNVQASFTHGAVDSGNYTAVVFYTPTGSSGQTQPQVIASIDFSVAQQ